MKKILLALCGLLLIGGIAAADWNIRQNPDGSADWVKARGADGAQVTAKIGRTHLTLYMSDISGAGTFGVVSPITDAKITRVDAVILGDVTGSASTFTIWRTTGTTGSLIASSVTNGTSPFKITPVAGAETGYTVSFTPTDANSDIERGTAILIHTDGGSTTAVPAQFTITLEPR